jgi:DNA repair exonuclease SbcCD ATPase subunit
VLDEPGKHLSEGYSRAFGELLKTVAEETGRQIIVVTHDPRLAEAADMVYRVKIENGASKVEKMS